MKRILMMLAVAASFGVAGIASAQTSTATTPKKATHKAEHKAAAAAPAESTVTGCVASAAKHYTLTADDKTVYDLSGGTLKPHVGHKVEVTGTTRKAAAGGHEVLKVKSVKMVAPNC